jgi:hypothetical protein
LDALLADLHPLLGAASKEVRTEEEEQENKRRLAEWGQRIRESEGNEEIGPVVVEMGQWIVGFCM